MSDNTPETDALIVECITTDSVYRSLFNLARKLERERNEIRKELEIAMGGWKLCQLDAMKEGMRRAAKIIEQTESPHNCDTNRVHENILTATEQLTEKDL